MNDFGQEQQPIHERRGISLVTSKSDLKFDATVIQMSVLSEPVQMGGMTAQFYLHKDLNEKFDDYSGYTLDQNGNIIEDLAENLDKKGYYHASIHLLGPKGTEDKDMKIKAQLWIENGPTLEDTSYNYHVWEEDDEAFVALHFKRVDADNYPEYWFMQPDADILSKVKISIESLDAGGDKNNE